MTDAMPPQTAIRNMSDWSYTPEEVERKTLFCHALGWDPQRIADALHAPVASVKDILIEYGEPVKP